MQQDDVTLLQRTADYLLVYKRLRILGRSSLLFGIFNLLAAATGPRQEPIINAILALIGVSLLIEGFWLLFFPTPRGVLLEALVLLLVGAGEITIAGYSWVAPGKPRIMVGLLGVAHIAGAFRWFRTYPRFEEALREPPPPEHLRGVDRLFDVLHKSAEKDPGVVHFNAPPLVWKGLLSREIVLFVDNLRQRALVARKADVEWTVQGKTWLGSKFKATMNVRDQVFHGLIAQPSYVKLHEWKPGKDDAEM